ncbi:O-antigen ligase family protein [Flavobacterium psychroterrae]|uniref:O-antigen ligase family protein n=1 Tax=Flavobacterium psychroterrae TaxID=2133767 RepID=A0ABS5P8L0_9FLAO|nr:O-antigen ligase family protein [Flavobacterium psychroterrae]MBS7230594.1 O-antigen ligase family protein [Flavobacterium psychroterrae]
MGNIRTNANKEISIIPEYLIYSFISLLLIIDFIPNKKVAQIADIQFLYISVLNLLLGIYLYMNHKMISYSIIPILKRSYIAIVYLIFLLFCALSFFVAKNTSLVITRLTELIVIFCLFINFSILLKDKLHLLYRIVFLICISTFFQSGATLYKFTQLYKFAPITEALSSITGNTGNVNIFAASLMIKVPFLLLGITHFTGIKKKFFLVVLFLATTAIFLTGARASLLSLSLVLFIYILYFLKSNSFNKESLIISLALIIPILLSLLISNKSFQKSQNNLRYTSVTNRITQINASDASAQARLNYWGNAIKMSKAKPILGIGLGNYRVESIPYEKNTEDDFTVSLDPHNDFLEIFAETGIINGVLYFSLFVFILFINIKKIVKSTNNNIKTIAVLTIMLLIVYGVDAFFNFPMYRPTMQIFFSLILALTIVNQTVSINENNYKILRIVILPIFISVCVITSYAAFTIYKASILECQILKDDINMKTEGELTGDEIISRLPKYPNVFLTSESFYEYAAIYYYREKKYDKALSNFAKATKINPYSGRINFYKHLIAKEKNNTDSAYIYIKEAFNIRPRNLFFYRYSINLAAVKNDTLEILKEHKQFSEYRKIPEAWVIPATELQKTNFNHQSLIRFIEQGIKEIPNDSTLLKLKKNILTQNYTREGQLFLSQAKFDKAIESYKKALKMDSEDVYTSRNIGLCYYFSGKYKQAVPYFLNALKYTGLNDGSTEFYIGSSYLKSNDHENACRYFNLSKDRNFSGAQQQLNQNCK